MIPHMARDCLVVFDCQPSKDDTWQHTSTEAFLSRTSLLARNNSNLSSYPSRCASAGDDGLVLVWNIEVICRKSIIPLIYEFALNTVALIAVSFCLLDWREAAGAEGPFPADNRYNHVHL